MVMHARKLPRLNDGYFDRNATHIHQASGIYKLTESSPPNMNNGPTNNGSRSVDRSPERLPNHRYINKTTYMQRLKEREKEKQLNDKESSQSPMCKVDKSSSSSSSSSGSKRDFRDSDHHRATNHSRNHAEEGREKRIQVGDWSEHISSSGKKYYYNCKTEVSQWEKPREWVDWERSHGMSRSSQNDQLRHKQNHGHRMSASSNSRAVDKHSVISRSVSSTLSSSSLSSLHNMPNRSQDDRHGHYTKLTRPTCSSNSSSLHSSTTWTSASNVDSTNCISSLNSVKPVDISSNKRGDSEMRDMDISPTSGDDTPTSSHLEPSPAHQLHQTPTSSSHQVSFAASLPKLLSQLASGNKNLVPNFDRTDLSAQEALCTIKKALELSRQGSSKDLSMHSPINSSIHADGNSPTASTQLSQLAATIHRALEARIAAAAPPRLLENDSRISPSSEYSHKSSKRGSPTSSISSLHSLSTNATNSNNNGVGSTSSLAPLKPQTISLTPSLANYYREDLINHVTGWQAEHAELQANKYGEEAFSTGSLSCTKVSSDLKTSRSLVRLTEIQATLQEQRILFIRQQIKDLEVWKSQNLFMSDS